MLKKMQKCIDSIMYFDGIGKTLRGTELLYRKKYEIRLETK